jgi:glycosyltransferase involved in cell wall biosynthesis
MTMVGAVHQVLPTFAARDAIGHHALRLRALLRSNGVESEIIAGSVQHDVRSEAHSLDGLAKLGGPNTTWLYHSSIGWPDLGALLNRPEPLAVDYHNITPADVFGAWEPHVGGELRLGRRQLHALVRRGSLFLADSAFNASELLDLGARSVHTTGIVLDDAAFAAPADASHTAAVRRASQGASWLFVGRLAPHKAQHRIVQAVALARHRDPRITLRLVGAAASHQYEVALRSMVTELGLDDAVTFVSAVSHAQLLAEYDAADVFVSASEHEGFCVPLIEAMHRDLPVIAYATTAVPETLGDGGLLLPSNEPAVLAAAAERVVADRALADRLRAAGRERRSAFASARTEQAHLELLRQWSGEVARR